MRKQIYVRIPTNWLSDYDLFPKRLLHGEVVLCTKNPYRFGEEIYKLVPVNRFVSNPTKEDEKDENA